MWEILMLVRTSPQLFLSLSFGKVTNMTGVLCVIEFLMKVRKKNSQLCCSEGSACESLRAQGTCHITI